MKTMYLLVLYLCVIIGSVHAMGKKFAVGFMRLDTSAGYCDLRFTTSANLANVTVEYPGNTIRFQVRLNQVYTRTFSTSYRTYSGIETKGIVVTSDADLTVHSLNAHHGVADGYLAVPLTKDAVEFYIPSYTVLRDRESTFSLISAEAGTQVSIYLRQSGGSYRRYGTYNLNKLQTFTLRSNSIDYTGTYVTSNKPIGVMAGHECAQVPSNIQYCDHLAVGVPPVSLLGRDFVVPAIGGRSSSTGYVVRVISTAASTSVKTDTFGTSVLSRGQFREYQTRSSFQSMNISCSNPCLVAQYNKGYTADRVNTDPFMMLIPAVTQYKNNFAVRTMQTGTRRAFQRNYLNIVVPSGRQTGVRLDRSSISASWRIVSGSQYVWTSVSVTDASHTITHTDPGVLMAVWCYGHAGYTQEGYGYQAGYTATDEVIAQPSRQFSVAFLHHFQNRISGFCDLYLTTSQSVANVTIEQDGITDSVEVRRGTATVFSITTLQRVDQFLENKGILISSDYDITVHGYNSELGFSDGFHSFPIKSWATEFYIPAYTPQGQAGTQFVIVASEDATSAYIYSRNPDGSYYLDRVALLNRFQTYTMRSREIDYTGTQIVSDKPVAVYSGHECANVPDSVGYCNHLSVGVPPLRSLGTTFVVPPITGRGCDVGYVIRVIATRSTTRVDASGLPSANLTRGEFVDYNSNSSDQVITISCTYPCLVAQYNKGYEADVVQAGPFMMLITPVEGYHTTFTWNTAPRGSENPMSENYVNLIVPRGKAKTAQLDGQNILNFDPTWTLAPGLTQAFMSVPVSNAAHLVSHPESGVKMAAFAYGHSGNGAESYGFSAGMNDGVPISSADATSYINLEVRFTATFETAPILINDKNCVDEGYFKGKLNEILASTSRCDTIDAAILEIHSDIEMSASNVKMVHTTVLPSFDSFVESTKCAVNIATIMENQKDWSHLIAKTHQDRAVTNEPQILVEILQRDDETFM